MKALRIDRVSILALVLVGGTASARYLSPEPLLQSPKYVKAMATKGMSVPTYAYAANNPLRYVDATGLYFSGVDLRLHFTLMSLERDPNIGPYVEYLRKSPVEIKFAQRSCREMLPYGGGHTYRASGQTTWNVDYNEALGDYSVRQEFGVGQTLQQLIAHELGHLAGGMIEGLSGAANMQRSLDWEWTVGGRRPVHSSGADSACNPEPPVCQ